MNSLEVGSAPINVRSSQLRMSPIKRRSNFIQWELLDFVRRVFVFQSVYGMITLYDARLLWIQITSNVMGPFSQFLTQKNALLSGANSQNINERRRPHDATH